ncbi:alpha/beta hydrolase [Leptolyngbya sp. 15MV]|nr:alpha/beta hydrolase [Leptolyngbya sp. 15MV]
MRRFWSEYLGERDIADAPLAALLQRDDLAGLPPATVVVGEHDPLRDEGLAFARKLEATGVPTELIQADGMIHGFFAMVDFVPDAAAHTGAAAARLKDALV